MPCYTQWNTYLKPGSKEYEDARVKLEAKLKAVKHILDYYYAVHKKQVPKAKYQGGEIDLQLGTVSLACDKRQMRGINEEEIKRNIAHHFLCDHLNVVDLYDISTLCNIHDDSDAGYIRIIVGCANDMRENNHLYQHGLEFINNTTK
jgi:hypothetical protein